jgi:hypothetical protein
MNPIYSATVVTSKLGVNFVKTVVESSGCIFHRIDQENDLGIDAIIELVKDGLPLNKQFGVQIKSGQSFYNNQSNQCLIPIGKHFDYWNNYPLSVYGIVYIPFLKSANWIDIKQHLRHFGHCNTIIFDRTKTNIFDSKSFMKMFVPRILKKLPKLSFDEAASLFHSDHPSEFYLGLVALFHTAPNEREVWDWFIDVFKKKDISDIPPIIVYYFAHIPWHGDIIYQGEAFSEAIKRYVKKRFDEFSKKDVEKLFGFIDEENGIARGSLGQSVETLVSSLTKRDSLLLEIIQDSQLAEYIRENAALIYAYHHPHKALPHLKALADEGSWCAGERFSFIKEHGWIDPYS